jgi:hypothetical protein
MDETALTPSRLWKQMSSAQREQAALAFWRDEQALDDQIQAALVIAQQKKFRPKTVMSLDPGRKAKHLASLRVLPDAIAARTLVVYHLATQRAMMGAFLDALGIAHENGLIEQDDVKPDPSRIPEAIAALERQVPAGDVALYLRTLVSQDADTWGALRGAIPAVETSA